MRQQGYAKLYERLLRALRPGQLALKVLLVLLIVLIPVWTILAIANVASMSEQPGAGLFDVLPSIAWLLALPFVLSAFVWLLYIFWSGSRPPADDVPWLAAYLLVAPLRPLTAQDERGLAYQELRLLQQFAWLEQRAASWRGYFLLMSVLGLVGIAGFWWFITRVAGDSGVPRPLLLGAAATIGDIVLLLLVSLGIVQLGRYAFDFLSTEPANRTILLACEEALALLTSHELQEQRRFDNYEKRWLVNHLGFRLVAGEDKSYIFEDSAGRRWMLLPLESRLTTTTEQPLPQVANSLRRSLIRSR